MKRRMFVLATIVLYFTLTESFPADLFSGNRKLNLAKSKYDPGPPPKGPNFSKIDAIERGLRFTNDGVNAEGKPTHNEWSGKFDGTERTIRAKAIRTGIQPC